MINFFNIFKYYREYKLSLEYDRIKKWLDNMNIFNYTINNDLTVDGNNVFIVNRGLTEIPVKFRTVTGYFDCSHNKLTSLKGVPLEVGGYFNCQLNNLTTLEYSPIKVGGSFLFSHNSLRTLKGCPKNVGDGYNYSTNLLPYEILTFNNISILIRNYEEYGLWNSDDTFNKGRWKIFIKDFESGILN